MSKNTHKLIIDPDYRDILPPLTNDEYADLESSILSEGCRDAIVVWGNTIIDGHNRYNICSNHNIHYRTVDMHFEDKQEAIDWILANQSGRRNLNPDYLSYIRGMRYNLCKIAKDKAGAIGGKSSGHNDHCLPRDKIKTSQKIADDWGVCEKTIRRDAAYATAVNALAVIVPDIQQLIAHGTLKGKQRVLKAAQYVETEPEKSKAILIGQNKKNRKSNDDIPPNTCYGGKRSLKKCKHIIEQFEQQNEKHNKPITKQGTLF